MTENGDKKEFGLPGVCGIALFTVLFCVLFPYLGFVSLAAVTAMTGVLVASWRNPLCFAVPLPGIAAAMLIWKSVPAGVILAALVLSGIVLGLVMRTHRSALSHVLSVVISYAVIAAAASAAPFTTAEFQTERRLSPTASPNMFRKHLRHLPKMIRRVPCRHFSNPFRRKNMRRRCCSFFPGSRRSQ